VLNQRLSVTLWDLEKSYSQSLYGFWILRPDLGVMQTVLLLVAWTHACIGLGLWLRLRPWFPRAAPYLLLGAVLLPLLALLGFYQQGKTVVELAKNPQWVAQYRSPARMGTPAQRATLLTIRDNFFLAYGGAIAFVFVARGVRRLRERSRGLIRVSYPDRTIRLPRGLTVLEASLRYRIPHASVCGGKARCSTCRIRIIGDRSGAPPPSAREAFVLDRVGASADPAVRLACQLRPQSDIAVVPMLPPQTNQSFSFHRSRIHLAQERYVVCMFIDMRGSVQMAEKRLPFDTVFMINRFLAAVSQAVLEAGGRAHQYLGDGLMALFGLRSDAPTACRQAINAAAMIAGNLDHLNKTPVACERGHHPRPRRSAPRAQRREGGHAGGRAAGVRGRGKCGKSCGGNPGRGRADGLGPVTAALPSFHAQPARPLFRKRLRGTQPPQLRRRALQARPSHILANDPLLPPLFQYGDKSAHWWRRSRS
jgi:adenylate cyclase